VDEIAGSYEDFVKETELEDTEILKNSFKIGYEAALKKSLVILKPLQFSLSNDLKSAISSLASDKAYKELDELFDGKPEDYLVWDEEQEESCYTEEAQILFNGFYDKIFNDLFKIYGKYVTE